MKKKADELQQELMEQLPELQEIKKIGQRIAFYRKQRHMTQQKLAERVHISKSYLSKIESVGTDITFSLFLLYKLARALDLGPISSWCQSMKRIYMAVLRWKYNKI